VSRGVPHRPALSPVAGAGTIRARSVVAAVRIVVALLEIIVVAIPATSRCPCRQKKDSKYKEDGHPKDQVPIHSNAPSNSKRK
jgi:hypothetical protein